MNIERETLLQLYEGMLRIRLFEEKVGELFAAGMLPGFVHLYLGEEAVAVGTCANLRPDDAVTSTHRGHGHMLAKGAEVPKMFAELFAKATGYCKGKGGSMHIADLDIGILGANGIVGGGPPIAAGSAFADQYLGSDRVTVCFFGDGASNQGTVHEALNLASIWKLPVVFVCENNGYGEYTPQAKHQVIRDVAERARGYGMPGVTIDGQDVIAVYETVGEAVRRARAGQGPSLIEAKTYRYHGHAEGDPQRYRTKAEIEEWRMQRDPIDRLRGRLRDQGLLSESEDATLGERLTAEIDAGVRFAEESPPPGPDELLTDVYSEA